MTTFIDKIISNVKSRYNGNYQKLCIVFPTRRACLIFRNKLAESHDTPVWAPGIMSIGDFVARYSGIKVGDEIPLLIALFDVYKKHWPGHDFGKYYSWGKMLLSDFDELDKQLHDPSMVFKNINELRKLEAGFLPDVESLKWIQEFIRSLDEKNLSRLQSEFADNWNRLEQIYTEYNLALDDQQLAYEGKAYRKLINKFENEKEFPAFEHFVFAGFYGFSRAEEKVIKLLSNAKEVSLFWDADNYYINHPKHEAGYYFRKSELCKGEINWAGNYLKDIKREVEIVAAPMRVAQAKYAGDLLNTLHKQGKLNINTTAIVLPDEDMLFPVLHSLPAEIDPVNVTMGYPLKNSFFSELFAILYELHKHAVTKKDKVTLYHKQHIDRLVNHPLMSGFSNYQRTNKDTTHYRILQPSEITTQYAFTASDIFFIEINSPEGLFNYIEQVLTSVAIKVSEKGTEAANYESVIINFLKTEILELKKHLINHLGDIKTETCWHMIIESVQNMKIPFSGEPVKGLQVMGFLETRALDFETVIVLNMNEGVLPTAGQAHSFIPFSLRKAFGLSTIDDKEATYSYHFFRLFHQASNIYLVYNSEVGKTGGGEPSRYLLQTEYELKKYTGEALNIKKTTISIPVKSDHTPPVVIHKTSDITKELSKYNIDYNEKDKRSFSSSALTTYINCSLQFYFRYMAGLKEPEVPGKYMEASDLGNVLHGAMEKLYSTAEGMVSEDKIDELETISEKIVEESINELYKVPFSQLNGNDILTAGIIKELTKRILRADKNDAPFKIVSLEGQYQSSILINQSKFRLYGKFDRVDEVNGLTRIIDYKTGKVELVVKELMDLFSDPKKKTLFQLYFYSLLYQNNHPGQNFSAGFYVAKNLNSGISYPKSEINTETIAAFNKLLEGLISEIMNPDIPFEQTTELKRCEYCPYKGICNR